MYRYFYDHIQPVVRRVECGHKENSVSRDFGKSKRLLCDDNLAYAKVANFKHLKH